MNLSPHTRRRGAALIAAGGLAASAVAAVPASATITSEGVADGHNITVFHNIDFVAVTGWAEGEELTVTVHRRGVEIGRASGQASDPEATGSSGLEVNHGPEGPPAAGDCWEGHTPDIRPGDVITVTGGGEPPVVVPGTGTAQTDQVIVDDIRFTGDPFLAGDGDVLVPFVARRANGDPIPASFIDSAEFRATSRLRFEATDILVQRAAGGAPGQYVMRYNAPYNPSRNRDLLNQRQLRNLLLGDGHAIGFGHTDPVPLEAMLHDGLADTPGPAPGCDSGEFAAPSAQWKVTDVAPGAVNLANQGNGLTVRGQSFDANDVTVALSDNDPATTGAPTTSATLSAAAGAQQWTARFTAAQLRDLDGRIRVAATFALADGSFTDRSMTVVKDLVAPNAPRASLASGTYSRARRVALRSAAMNTIRYTLGDGKQARPTRNSGNVYKGRRIRISATQTLKMIAIDPAGNVSPLAKRRYRIR
ncbi:MAG: chitobiase/beta-hexosaminidase C-terminal domain-containing protein [Actinomycetota bacterium]|nr:chitobiase/beta-hexosaminidase C-terminal domain-containing protein [Actinomycetota bacterium]